MKSSLSPKMLAVVGVVVAALAVAVVVLLMRIPTVVGLGDRVKLPLLHGGSTWVNLMLFLGMGVLAVIYLVRRSDRVYAWEVGLRAVASPLWLINSTLGFIAARTTWDFSASKESPLVFATHDPRLVAQFVLLAGVAVMLIADWTLLEKRAHKAIADVIFTIVGTVMMADIFLDPVKRALHPDSPVLNSGWEIKAPFFGMVGAIFALTLVLAWVASTMVSAETDAV